MTKTMHFWYIHSKAKITDISLAINTWLIFYFTPSQSVSNLHKSNFIFSHFKISLSYLFPKIHLFIVKISKTSIFKPVILVFLCFSVRKLTCFCFQDPQLSSCYLDIWPITHYLSVIYRFSAKHMTGVMTQFIANALILARRV